MHSEETGRGKVPGSHLNPKVSLAAHKIELFMSAATALKATGARSVLRHRLLPDDPTLAATPIGHRDAVEIAAVGEIEIRPNGIRGLFKLRACAVPA